MSKHELIVTLGLNSASFQQQLKALNKELKLHEQEYKKLASGTKDFEKTQDGLNAKMKATQKSMDFAKAHIKLYEDAYVSATNALKESMQKQREYNDALNETRGKLKQSKETLDDNRQAYQYYKEELKDANKEHSSVTREIGKLEKSLTQAREGYEKSSNKIQEYTTKNSKLNSLLEEQKVKFDKQNNELIKSRLEYEKSNRALETHKDKLNRLENAYEQNAIRIKEQNSWLEIAKQKFGENSKSVESLKQELDRLTLNEEKLTNEIKQQKQVVESAQNSTDKLRLTYEKQGNALQKISNKMKEYESKIEKNNIQIEKFKTKQLESVQAIEKSTLALAKAKTEYDKTEQKVKELESALEKAKTEYEGNAREVQELENELKGLQSDFEKASKNVERYANQMRDAQTNVAKFETELNKLNQELQETVVKMATLKLDNFSDKMGKVSNTLSSIGQPMQQLGQNLTTYVSAPLVAMGGLASKTFLDFDKQVQRSATLIGKEGKTIEETYSILEKGARELGKSTVYTAEEVAKGYEYMAMASWNVTDSVKAMPSVLDLATIGMLDLGQASDIVTDYMTPFKMSADETGKFVDIMATTITNANTDIEMMGETLKYVAPVAGMLGISMEETSVAIGTLANSGIKASSAGTGLATGLTRLLKPTDKAKELMDKYGISIKKTSDGSVDLDGTIKGLRKAFEGLTKTQKIQASSTIFGLTAQKTWMTLIEDTSSYEKLEKAMENTSGATDKMIENLQKSGSYAFDVMKSSINDLGISLGNALAPALIEGAKLITELTNKVSNWVTYMQENEPHMLKFIGGIGLFAIVIPPVLMALGTLTLGVSSLCKGLSVGAKLLSDWKAKSILAKGGTDLLNGSTSKTTGFLGKALDKVKSFTGSGGLGNLAKVATSLGEVVLPTLSLAILGVGTAFGDNVELLNTISDKLGKFGEVISGTMEMFNGLFGTMFKNLGVLFKGIGKLFDSLKPGGQTPADAWKEIMSEIEYNIKVGNSRSEGEMARSLQNLNNMTDQQGTNMVKIFEKVMEQWETTGKDGGEKLATTLSSRLKFLKEDTIQTLRGTSDTMAVLFNGIYENMDKQQAFDTFKNNIRVLKESGTTDITTLREEFKESLDYINANLMDSATNIEKNANTMFDALKDGGNIREVSESINKELQGMNINAVNHLRNLGSNWRWLFRGITEDDLTNGKDLVSQIEKNLGDLANNDENYLEGLKTQMTEGLALVKDETLAKTKELKDLIKVSGVENGEELVNGFIEGTKSRDDLLSAFGDKSTNEITSLIEELKTLGAIGGQDIAKSLEEGTMTEEQLFAILGENGEQDLTQVLGELENTAYEGGKGIGQQAELGTKEGLVTLPQSVKDELAKVGISIDEQGNVIVENMADKAKQASKAYVDNLNSELPQLSQVSQNIQNQLSGIDNVRLGNVTKQLSEVNRWLGVIQNKAIETGMQMMALTRLPFGNTTKGLSEINNWLMRTSNRSKDARTNMVQLTNLPFGNTTKGLSEVNNWLMRTTNRAKDSANALKEIVKVTYGSVTKGLSEINKWLTNIKSGANTTTTALRNMANVRFGGLTSALSQVSSWLGTVKSKASVASVAVSKVKNSRAVEVEPQPQPQEPISMEQAVARRASTIDISKFKTSGGLYTPTSFSSKSMANLNKPSVQKDNSNQVLELLTQLIQVQADKTVELVVNLDGRQIAKASSKYMEQEMNSLSSRKNRLGGIM